MRIIDTARRLISPRWLWKKRGQTAFSASEATETQSLTWRERCLSPLFRGLISPSGPWLAGFGLVFVAQTLFLHGSAVRSSPQPIAFNHAKHIAGGLDCTDCHAGARTEEHATVPGLATCMTCHESAAGKSPEEAKIRMFAAAGREIPWQPVTHVPTHVYFSHRRHVTVARLECGVCHGAMEKLTAPPPAPAKRLDMATCIECHEKKQARTDCNDCHR